MKKVVFIIILLVAGLSILSMDANAATTYGSAFKSPFTILWDSIRLDHTYFCLNGTSDCYAINGWGIQSSSTGGTRMWDTYGGATSSERCASRARASNNVLSPCYIIYGVTGVCHMQTNRGLASFGKRMNHGNILGGWASQLAYGYYGGGWTLCKSTSNVGCGRWPWER
jgi:hypothetical protein